MKKWAIFLLVGMAGCSRSGSQVPINIGHVGTQSGPERRGDEQAARGLRLALTDPALGKVEDRPLQVRHTDTRDQLDAYEAQAVRLVSVSKAAALYGGHTADQVRRLDKARVPLLSPSGHKPSGVSDLAFFLGLSPAFEGQCLAAFAAERLGKEKATAILLRDERLESADLLVQSFVKTWDDAWANNAALKTPSPTILSYGKDAKWTELAEKIPGKGATCVLFVGGPEDFRALLTHAPTNISLLLYGGSDGSLADAPPSRVVYRVTAFTSDASLDGAQDFIKKFTEAHKSAPDVHSALGYEAMTLLQPALKKAAASGNSLSAELRGTKDFVGLTGTYSFTDQVLRRPAFLVRQEGRGEKLERKFDP